MAQSVMAQFLEQGTEQFSAGIVTLEELEEQWKARFTKEEFPFGFALRLDQAGFPKRFMRDLEMQCVKGDLESLVNALRQSYVFGGIARETAYAQIGTLSSLAAQEYTAVPENETLQSIASEALKFIQAQPSKTDVDTFFELYHEKYDARAFDRRGLYVEFREQFPGCTASFEYFDYELRDVFGESQRRAPRDIARTREQSSLFQKMEEEGVLYVIEYFALRPEFIPDVLVAMHPQMALDKESLKRMFGPAVPETDETRSLRHYLGVCRRQRFDAMQVYDGRQKMANDLSDIAAKIFQNAHHAEEVVTRILVDVVRPDYADLFRQNKEEAMQELGLAIENAGHEYARGILEQVRDYYKHLQHAKLLGIRPVITVK